MTRSIKSVLGRPLFNSRVGAVLLGHAAVVVAFHRIQRAAVRDPLTIDVDMFERYCRFFRQHFRVVGLRDLVHRLERRAPLNRELAITFDDGYRDNFEFAAPVLKKLSLPATFFVVPHWIGTDVVPWWDRQQGVRHPLMTWDHVRALHLEGFEIGAHTRTHADLSKVAGATAHEEILGARTDLERALNAPIEMFAYPYGGRRDIAESNRETVRTAGFRCCCSCYGGVNRTGTDPFHLRRVPISQWYLSPYQFGCDIVFGLSVVSGT